MSDYDVIERRIDWDSRYYNEVVQYVLADVNLSRDAYFDPAKRQLVLKERKYINLENE